MHTFVVIVGAKVSVFVATSDVRMLRAVTHHAYFCSHCWRQGKCIRCNE